MEPRFVDIHSHVVPSGDDGVQSVSEGLSLGRDAFEHGTRVLYASISTCKRRGTCDLGHVYRIDSPVTAQPRYS